MASTYNLGRSVHRPWLQLLGLTLLLARHIIVDQWPRQNGLGNIRLRPVLSWKETSSIPARRSPHTNRPAGLFTGHSFLFYTLEKLVVK